MRSRVGLTDGATRIPEVARPRPGALPHLLFRYLAVGFVLLATVVVATRHARRRRRPDPWDYQREQVDIQGRVLNAYAGAAVRATAWLGRPSIERGSATCCGSACSTSWSAGAADSVGGRPTTPAGSRRPPRPPCWGWSLGSYAARPGAASPWPGSCCWSRPWS